jgi:hypothetical protein
MFGITLGKKSTSEQSGSQSVLTDRNGNPIPYSNSNAPAPQVSKDSEVEWRKRGVVIDGKYTEMK